MQHTYARPNGTVMLTLPDPTPDALAGFAWPEEIAALLTAADDAWRAMTEAEIDWTQARDDLQLGAPSRDKALLVEAVKSGKADPGTPATDAAQRAEEVAWVKFEVAREAAAAPAREAKAAVVEYLAKNADQIAAHEVAVLEAAQQAHDAAEQAARDARTASRIVGALWGTVHAYSHGRYDATTWMLAPDYKYVTQSGRDALRARYEAIRDGRPDPTTVVNAGARQF
ncbi:hypothetical protein [Demequina flava]|uniref:hypothetical protein n=1 Tax=Demequina flava TaxID=1095025 RepID=UPI0007839D64|nr:hypothetical protein [Demequina flava]